MTANVTSPTQPKRLLNRVVDDMAKDSADALYAELPLSPTSFGAGFRKVTYRAFANAINGMAWWLHRTLGPGRNFETLLYLGPNDLRHNVLLLGAVKSGYKMLFTSPRYSTLAQINLIKLVDCKTVLAPAARPPVTDAILDAHEMQVYQIPELEELFDQNHPYYPFEKTFEQARGEPLVVLHTSGTTGLPKPVIWTHDWAASFARERRLAPPLGFESSDNLLLGNRVLSMMAPFHAGHLFASVLFAIFCRTTVIYPLSAVPSSAELVVECLKHTKADAVMLVPPYVEEIGRSPEILEFLSRNVETLLWAGGDVSLAAGNAISSKIKLFTTCGSTEMGMWPTLHRSGKWPSEYWKFMNIHHAANIEFRHQSDNLHEAFVKRNPEFEDEQPVFKVFPNLQEFSSGDLFSPHPLDPQLWQYCGRTDDMQVFSSGEKYHPVTVEQRINRHPDVQEALLVGTQRPRAALLLEMKADTLLETPEQQADAIARLWPVIQDANQLCPVYAKITKEHILFVHPHKPMARTAKGTVRRKPTTELYKEELDKLFTSAAAASVPAPLTAHSLIIGMTFGKECAGVVIGAGEDCEVLSGNRVVMYASETFKSFSRGSMCHVCKISENMVFLEATAVPAQFGTAWQVVHEIAQIRKNETILIHAGAGGTGQAAIQISQYLGAEVFATVSSNAKRDILKAEYGIPEDHIFYSWDTSFTKGIKWMTEEHGVNVFINALAGESLVASWECIASYGRSIEIGKKDILSNSSLPMFPFRKNANFTCFDGSTWLSEQSIPSEENKKYSA